MSPEQKAAKVSEKGYSLGDLYAVMQTHGLNSVSDAIDFVLK